MMIDVGKEQVKISFFFLQKYLRKYVEVPLIKEFLYKILVSIFLLHSKREIFFGGHRF